MNAPIPFAVDARHVRAIDPPPVVHCEVGPEILTAAMTPAALGPTVDPLVIESIVAVLRWIFGRDVPASTVASWVRPHPALDRTALVSLDDHGRMQLMLAATMVSLADQRLRPARAHRLESLAQVLQLDPVTIKQDCIRFTHERKLARLRWHLVKDSMDLLLPANAEQSRPRLLWSVGLALFFGIGPLQSNPQLGARFEALGDLPRDTLGWALHRHYRVHGFPTPGESRGFAEFVVPHELAHVISGYEPHAFGEMLVSAFQAGNTPKLAMPMMLATLLQYHLGIKVDYRPERGLLVPDDFFRAYARGRATTLDLYQVAWMDLITRNLDELRASMGLAPTSDRPPSPPHRS